MIGVTAAATGAYFMRGDIVPAVAAPWPWGLSSVHSSAHAFCIAVSNERVRLLFVMVLLALAVQMTLSGFGIKLEGLPE